MTTNPERTYRSLATLVLWCVILYVAEILINAMASLSTAGQIQLLEAARFGVRIPPGLTALVDTRERLLAALQIGMGLAAGVCFLVWVYRANRNARALGAEGMTYTPGFSVLTFFIPLANLVLPYVALKEIWKASRPDAGEQWRQATVSPILGAWWAMSLVSGINQYSPFPVLSGDRKLADIALFGARWTDSLWEFSWGLLICRIVGIVAQVLTVVVVLRITELQERKETAINEGKNQPIANEV